LRVRRFSLEAAILRQMAIAATPRQKDASKLSYAAPDAE
jgi:hypothetical protein